jgi:hypothetical protein
MSAEKRRDMLIPEGSAWLRASHFRSVQERQSERQPNRVNREKIVSLEIHGQGRDDHFMGSMAPLPIDEEVFA